MTSPHVTAFSTLALSSTTDRIVQLGSYRSHSPDQAHIIQGLQQTTKGFETLKNRSGEASDPQNVTVTLSALQSKMHILDSIPDDILKTNDLSKIVCHGEDTSNGSSETTLGALTIAMMKDVCSLIENNANKSGMQDEVDKLHTIMARLSSQDPSVRNSNPSNSSHDFSQQFHHNGPGTQNNNTGPGKQLLGNFLGVNWIG